MLLMLRNNKGEFVELLNLYAVKSFRAAVQNRPDLPGVQVIPNEGVAPLFVGELSLDEVFQAALRQGLAGKLPPEDKPTPFHLKDGSAWEYHPETGLTAIGYGSE